MNSIQAATDAAIQEGWIQAPVVPALYVSAGGDTNPFTLLHPTFLAKQARREIAAPNFFVFIDAERPGNGENAGLEYSDGHTTIRTISECPIEVAGVAGHLLLVVVESDQMESRQVAVLRLRMINDEFAQVAADEGWTAEWFIGVCDGCGAFGGNLRDGGPWCENNLEAEHSIPLRLGARFWVTDHFWRADVQATREGGADDLVDGQLVTSTDPSFPIGLRQSAFLSTSWRSRVVDTIRLYGGARVFEVEQLADDASSEALAASLSGSAGGT